jgi:hypothetical protein
MADAAEVQAWLHDALAGALAPAGADQERSSSGGGGGGAAAGGDGDATACMTAAAAAEEEEDCLVPDAPPAPPAPPAAPWAPHGGARCLEPDHAPDCDRRARAKCEKYA